ncbi:MetQ/NlpA family ABC transporter substrate-binding protein [Brochothrix campestris]
MQKKIMLPLTLLLLMTLVLAGCGSQQKTVSSIKVGILADNIIWQQIKDASSDNSLKITYLTYATNDELNQALAAKEIDVAGSQTISAFDNSKQKLKLDSLVSIGSLYWAPLGLYSSKYKQLTDLHNGDTIALPADPAELGRALVLLNEAKVITLNANFNGKGDLNKIVKNPMKLKFHLLTTADEVRLDDYEAVALTNEAARKQKLTINDKALTIEVVVPKAYVTILATRTDNQTDQVVRDFLKLSQSKQVITAVTKQAENGEQIVKMPLESLDGYETSYTEKVSQKSGM